MIKITNVLIKSKPSSFENMNIHAAHKYVILYFKAVGSWSKNNMILVTVLKNISGFHKILNCYSHCKRNSSASLVINVTKISR